MLKRPMSDSDHAPTAGGQAAQRHHARQVSGDEGDVEAADEEPRGEQQEALVMPRVAHGVAHRLLGGRAHRRKRMLAAQHPGERHDGQREQAECGQRADPADRAGEERRERRDDELSKRPSGVDHAAREAALLGGERSRDRGHQHPEPGHAAPARRDDADEQHEHPRARGVRREHRAEHDEHGARGHHAAGPVLIGHGAGDRLRDAPHELRTGEREADRGDAEAGR